MPRKYKPDPRSKRYKKYDSNIIQQAVDEYSNDGSSLDCIAKKYQIHKSVLYRHCNKTMKSHGGQTVLSKRTEEEFIKYLNVCGGWGYPLEAYDLRLMVKLYLDKLGIIEKRFKNNMPGPDFVSSFLKRHKDVISKRIFQKIKRNRAIVSPEVIKTYFEELKLSLNDVPMCNVINYDEINLADDPGCTKILTKRGAKYPEQIMNDIISSVSVMITCTAEGELLPPYVVYKSQYLYDTWTNKGPKGTRYNRSQSGWFDGIIFEDWVKTIIMPYFQGKPGKKIFIGDNLSSTLSIDLIKLCLEEDIHFVFLPAKSTHITQPLDVAFFKSIELAWRNILNQWEQTDDRKQAIIPKACFPILLANLFENLKNNARNTILAGFRKTGINPFDPTQVLNRLSEHKDDTHQFEAINKSISKCGINNRNEPKRKRKIEAEPGKCKTVEGCLEETESENTEAIKNPKKTGRRGKGETENNNQNIDKPCTSYKGKGVGKKNKILLDTPLIESDPFIPLGSMPIPMNDDEITIIFI